MSKRRKRQFRVTTFLIVPAILVLAALFVALSSTQQAGAVDGTVRSALQTFVNNQYTGDPANEYGFIIDAWALHGRIDSNGDGTYLGEGDNAALNPVLVDVLEGQPTMIPTTAIRGTWNTNMLDGTHVSAIASNVNAHQAAGFSTDVVAYCLTGHTEAAAAGGLGAVAGAGGLGGATTPKVLSLKYGRAGWGPTTNSKTFTATNPVGPPDALPAPYGDAATPATGCGGSGAELVRCTAQWALSATGGNVGNGINPPTTAYQAIDLRPGGGTTIEQANPTYNIPVNTIFSTGMNYLNPAATPKKLFVGPTQHMAGMIATGAEMLGYDSAFLQWGLANYNNTLPEIYNASDNAGYAQVAPSFDIVAPGQGGVSHGSLTKNSAVITRASATEPATMKVEYGTSPGVYTQVANNTVLTAGVRQVPLTGLSEFTTYYYRVTAYDGMANASAAFESSFTTLDGTGPVVSNGQPVGLINSTGPNITADISDNLSGVNVATVSVQLDGSPLAGCTTSGTAPVQVSCPTSGLAQGGHNVVVSVSDNAGNPVQAGSNQWSFTVDSLPPAFSNNLPTGLSGNDNPVISVDYNDVSGVNASATTVTLSQGGTPVGGLTCTPTSSSVSCSLAAPLANGAYDVIVTATDNASNTGSIPWSFTVDTSFPAIDPPFVPAPSSWITDNTPDVTMNYHFSGTGTIDSASLEIDGVSCATYSGAGTPQTGITCTAPVLANGPHTVHGSVGVGTKVATHDWAFSVDDAKPVFETWGPTGDITDSTPDITFDYFDDHSGVNPVPGSFVMTLDGNPLNLNNCAINATTVTCNRAVGGGVHNVHAEMTDVAGNTEVKDWSFKLTQRTYYFPWYDSDPANFMNGDWIMLTNAGNNPAGVDIYIGGTLMFQYDDGTGPGHGPRIPAGEQVAWKSDTPVTNGPVRIVSTEGQELLASQRVIFKDSFNEVLAVDENDLDSDYYFTWYDNNADWGMNSNWVMAANVGANPTDINIYVGDVGSGATPVAAFPNVAPGGIVTWQSPTTVTGGPVRVTGGAGSQLLASQRVIYKDAFNEVMGAAHRLLDTEGYFTWYDNEPSWGMNGNWVLATNAGTTDTTVEIYINNVSSNPVATLGPVAPGQSVAWQSPTPLTDGPVRALSTNAQTLLVSERTLYMDSFEEIQGTTPANMGDSYLFNWYDSMIANGMKNDWLLGGNYGSAGFDANIAIGGTLMPNPVGGGIAFPIGAHSSIFPQFGEKMDGPVAMECAGCSGQTDFLASQRVIFKDSFNEVVGKGYRKAALPTGWDIIINVPPGPAA